MLTGNVIPGTKPLPCFGGGGSRWMDQLIKQPVYHQNPPSLPHQLFGRPSRTGDTNWSFVIVGNTWSGGAPMDAGQWEPWPISIVNVTILSSALRREV